jgi:two-component system LytT family sensor kinase
MKDTGSSKFYLSDKKTLNFADHIIIGFMRIKIQPFIRAVLNVCLLLFLAQLTLSNTKNLVMAYPQDASLLYLHAIAFNAITVLAIAFNNLYLIPQFLFKRKKVALYLLCLLVLLLLAIITGSAYLQYLFAAYPPAVLSDFTILAMEFYAAGDVFLERHLVALFPTLSYVLIFGLAFILRHLYTSNKKLRLSKEAQLKAELSLLKAQVNPHFLFNMMNSIYSQALTKSDDAPATILKLSEILRYNLYESSGASVPLSKELQMIQTYLELEHIRLENPEKVSFEQQVEDAERSIAPMLLLPIVENAFKHGMGSNIAQGFIHIYAADEPDCFTFECINNYKQKLTKSEHSGLGLENLRRRLQLIYPNRHSLDLDVTDTLFTVRLNIKFNS